MDSGRRTSLAVLVALGVISAIVCVGLVRMRGEMGLLPGSVFGMALAAYFVVHEKHRTPFRALLLICACAVSFPLSIWAALGVRALLGPLGPGSSSSGAIPLYLLFSGGCVGAGLVLLSSMLLFGRRSMTGVTFTAIVLGAVGGGGFGLLGGVIHRLLLDRGSPGQLAALFLVWQPGILLMLGLLLNWERKAPTEPAPRADSPPANRRDR